jgi:DNA topoisomerase-1
MPALVHVSDDEPGIERHGRSRFQYVRQTTRKPVRSGRDLERIKALAIPPAWTDVWICADPNGHIQATGRDARGRKQYRYHPAFRQRRERRKFDQLVPFGQALSDLRAALDRDLRQNQLGRERVLAAVVSLLELTYVRVGNEAYARENRSYGLTTLKCSHVDVDGSRLKMHFRGKGGKWLDVSCCDARLARVVRRCQELPGQQLFQYEDGDGGVAHVTSTDVNDYLRDVTGLDATAKTFRTWGATLMAAEHLAILDPPVSEREANRVANDVLRDVAAELGNTLAVCRASYVHPVVLETFGTGQLHDQWHAGPTRARQRVSAAERKLLRVLSAADA